MKFSSVDGAERCSDSRRSSCIGPRAHVRIDTNEVFSGEVGGFCEGQGSDAYSEDVWRQSRNFSGGNFLARGSLVAVVGRDEQVIREHIRRQKEKGKNFLDQSRLFEEPSLGDSSFVTHLGC